MYKNLSLRQNTTYISKIPKSEEKITCIVTFINMNYVLQWKELWKGFEQISKIDNVKIRVYIYNITETMWMQITKAYALYEYMLTLLNQSKHSAAQ